MGILTGYICVLFLILLLAKYITRKFHCTRMNVFLMRIHKHAACGFLIVSFIHLLLVIKVFSTRAVLVSISGMIILVMGILLTLVCHTMKNRKTEFKFHRFFSLLLALMTSIHIVSFFIDLDHYMTCINNIQIDEISLKDIENGEYIGEYDAGYIYAKVKITVNSHSMEKQSVAVDAVSGATNSSQVIKMACFNALTHPMANAN